MIERFLKQRHAAEVCVGKVDISPRLDRLFADSAPDEIWPRADHRVAPTHYIEPVAQVVNVRMRTREVRETHVRELLPVVVEKRRAAIWVLAHRVVIRQDRRTVINAFQLRLE